jgi:hypothetical protein
MRKNNAVPVPEAAPKVPELEHAKTAVLNSLESTQSRRSYEHAMDEFVSWYCSAARLAFNRTVVLQYRTFLEKKQLAAATINVRLAAVRRLAYEAADSGILSVDAVAGIRRAKGVPRGVPVCVLGQTGPLDKKRTLRPGDILCFQ